MPPEDFERILPLINEVADLKLSRTQAMLQAKYDAQIADLSRESKRSSEFNQLLSDPLFTNEEVAFEINKIFEANPKRLQLEPTPWHNAFNEALANIARRNLQGTPQAEENGNPLPSAPPKSGGQSTSMSIPSNNPPGTVIDKFKRLDTKDMEKELLGLGAIKPQQGVFLE